MYEGVSTLFRTNSETVNSIQVLKDSVSEFESTMDTIRSKSAEVNNASTGKTAAKIKAEDELTSILLPVAAGLFVYAKKQNDTELKEKAKVTESGLFLMRDTELAGKGEEIANLAAKYTADLPIAGITEKMISDLKSKSDAYRVALGSRESSVAERIGARTSMQDLFVKADDILEEEIDPAMELVRGSNTQFYNEYFAARVIKDLGIRHRQQATAPAAAPAK
jgi:hypothetical protein